MPEAATPTWDMLDVFWINDPGRNRDALWIGGVLDHGNNQGEYVCFYGRRGSTLNRGPKHRQVKPLVNARLDAYTARADKIAEGYIRQNRSTWGELPDVLNKINNAGHLPPPQIVTAGGFTFTVEPTVVPSLNMCTACGRTDGKHKVSCQHYHPPKPKAKPLPVAQTAAAIVQPAGLPAPAAPAPTSKPASVKTPDPTPPDELPVRGIDRALDF
jgi:hypothetical protein